MHHYCGAGRSGEDQEEEEKNERGEFWEWQSLWFRESK